MYHQKTMDFSEWLVAELAERGWSRSEAARRGNISPSMFDKVINGHAKPGIKFLDGLAQAFKMPSVFVYRKAGLLPEGGKSITFDDWQNLLTQLLPEEQEEMREIMQMKIERRQKTDKSARSENFKSGKIKK